MPLKLEDDIVQERLGACYARLGIEKPWRHPAITWFGFAKDGVVSLVLGAVVRGDNSIEVTDFYPAPTREGVKAGHTALDLLNMLVEYRVIPEWLGGVINGNDKGLFRAQKHFGLEVVSTVVRKRRKEATA